MKRKELEQKVANLLTQVLLDGEIELVDVEYVREGKDYFLRVFLDKPGGITINDCEAVSRQLDAKLDEYDWIGEHYFLEVSSPGLDRPLKKPSDFARSKGKRVEVKLYQSLDGKKRYEGILVDKENDTLVIEMDDKQQVVLQEALVASVKLAITF